MVRFYRQYFVPENTFLTIIGNVDPPAAIASVREKLSAWPKGDPLPSSPPSPHRQEKFVEVRARKFLDQAIVVLAFQAMGLGDPDRPVFEIINAVLGSGGNSRLYQEIREKKGLSYLVGSLYHPLSDTGLWGTYAGTAPKNIDKIKSIISEQIRKIQQEPLLPEELDEIKNYIRGRTLIRNENNSTLSAFIGRGLLAGAWSLPEDFISKVEKVNAEDVMRVARTYLREDQGNLIVLKPYPGLWLLRKFF